MEALSLIPPGLIALGYIANRFLDEKWAQEVDKALFSSAVLFSIILGLDIRYTSTYAFLAILVASKTKAIYSAVFGGLIAVISYFIANPLLSVVPLTIMGLASPLSFLINRASGRSHRGGLWTFYMFAISASLASFVFVSMGPVNPWWGLVVAGVVTWAGRVDRDFALPMYSIIPMGYPFAPVNGLVAGFGFSLVASSFAYYLKSLDINGLIGAVVLGTLVYSASPVLFLATLMFLVSASLLGRFAKHDERFQKKGKRNAVQVISNGFGPALASLMIFSGYDALGLGIAAVAAATADTWATEIGSLSKRNPRLITNMKIVERGRSGGVTPLGLGASLGAGIFIFLTTFPFTRMDFLLHAVIGGVIGSLVDSFFGATSQGIFRCRMCSKLTEKESHCSKPALREYGVWWFNNDLVNLFSTLIAMVAFL